MRLIRLGWILILEFPSMRYFLIRLSSPQRFFRGAPSCLQLHFQKKPNYLNSYAARNAEINHHQRSESLLPQINDCFSAKVAFSGIAVVFGPLTHLPVARSKR